MQNKIKITVGKFKRQHRKLHKEWALEQQMIEHNEVQQDLAEIHKRNKHPNDRLVPKKLNGIWG